MKAISIESPLDQGAQPAKTPAPKSHDHGDENKPTRRIAWRPHEVIALLIGSLCALFSFGYLCGKVHSFILAHTSEVSDAFGRRSTGVSSQEPMTTLTKATSLSPAKESSPTARNNMVVDEIKLDENPQMNNYHNGAELDLREAREALSAEVGAISYCHWLEIYSTSEAEVEVVDHSRKNVTSACSMGTTTSEDEEVKMKQTLLALELQQHKLADELDECLHTAGFPRFEGFSRQHLLVVRRVSVLLEEAGRLLERSGIVHHHLPEQKLSGTSNVLAGNGAGSTSSTCTEVVTANIQWLLEEASSLFSLPLTPFSPLQLLWSTVFMETETSEKRANQSKDQTKGAAVALGGKNLQIISTAQEGPHEPRKKNHFGVNSPEVVELDLENQNLLASLQSSHLLDLVYDLRMKYTQLRQILPDGKALERLTNEKVAREFEQSFAKLEPLFPKDHGAVYQNDDPNRAAERGPSKKKMQQDHHFEDGRPVGTPAKQDPKKMKKRPAASNSSKSKTQTAKGNKNKTTTSRRSLQEVPTLDEQEVHHLTGGESGGEEDEVDYEDDNAPPAGPTTDDGPRWNPGFLKFCRAVQSFFLLYYHTSPIWNSEPSTVSTSSRGGTKLVQELQGKGKGEDASTGGRVVLDVDEESRTTSIGTADSTTSAPKVNEKPNKLLTKAERVEKRKKTWEKAVHRIRHHYFTAGLDGDEFYEARQRDQVSRYLFDGERKNGEEVENYALSDVKQELV
ncbi:unnamed protein product [Amoebophrya sp. A120]|nr:unnamed protein product [Amoebophrya sp. A120]|eukprot:GSA120T00020781001.1